MAKFESMITRKELVFQASECYPRSEILPMTHGERRGFLRVAFLEPAALLIASMQSSLSTVVIRLSLHDSGHLGLNAPEVLILRSEGKISGIVDWEGFVLSFQDSLPA